MTFKNILKFIKSCSVDSAMCAQFFSFRLAETFLDGLIWRSHKTSQGMRPVIYYLEHLVKDMDESEKLSRALISF